MKEVGLWIDHKKAIVVVLANKGEEIIKQIESKGKQIQSQGRAGAKTLAAPLAEDHRDKRFMEHLNKYYNEVIAYVRDAESLLILGPGEAKIELEKRLRQGEFRGRVAGIETADKLTGPQIVAKVRRYFLKQPAPAR